MDRFLICANSKCLFVLDRRIQGQSSASAEAVLSRCPSCRGDWSSTCPACGQALSVKAVDGRPHRVCCEAKAKADSAAQMVGQRLALAANLSA